MTRSAIVQALQEKPLKRVLADWSPTFPGPFLYYPNRRHSHSTLHAAPIFFCFPVCALCALCGGAAQAHTECIHPIYRCTPTTAGPRVPPKRDYYCDISHP
jgi:hypothetical protein